MHDPSSVNGVFAAAKTRDAIKVGLADATQLMLNYHDNAVKRSHPTIYVLVEKLPHESFDFIKKHLQQKFYCYCLCEMQCKAGGDYEALWCDMHTSPRKAWVMWCRHPVKDGESFYSAKVTCVTQFVKKLKPVLKGTRIALQIGTIAARCARMPSPWRDVWQLCGDPLPRPVQADPQGVGQH